VRRLRGDDALVGGVDALVFGVLIFVTMSLAFVNLWVVIETKIALSAAAHEAARAFVEAPDSDGAAQRAQLVARDVLRAHGIKSMPTIEVEGAFSRCTRITVTARAPVAGISLGWLGQWGQRQVAARASEVVDPYRSDADLPEGTTCG